MTEKQITEELNQIMPLQLSALDLTTVEEGTGLVIVDEVNGFATELIGALGWTGPWYVISAATGEGCASLTGDIFSWIATEQQGVPRP